MAREILDDVVRSNLEKANTPLSLFDSLPQYQGDVNTKLDRVKLDESEITVESVSIEELLRTTMLKFQITEEECIFKVGDRVYPISNDLCRLLKSLLFNQVSENVEYSQAMAKSFYTLMRQIINGMPVGDIPIDVNASLFEQYIMSKVGDFVKSTLAK